jgi:hypothetical protein
MGLVFAELVSSMGFGFRNAHQTSFSRHLNLIHGVVSQTGARPVETTALGVTKSGGFRWQPHDWQSREPVTIGVNRAGTFHKILLFKLGIQPPIVF